jgi:type VI secretion system protein ImpA
LDVESLLRPVSEDNPAGEDLDHAPERAELSSAFEVDVSFDDEGNEVRSPDPDWRKVLKNIESQFARTRDIWLAVALCRAGARSGAIETVSVGAQVLAGLLEQFWDTAYPHAPDDDLQMRKAPLDWLADRSEFLAPLERTVLLRHARFGVYTATDFERFRAEGDKAKDVGLFRAALKETGEPVLAEALTHVERIEDGTAPGRSAFAAHPPGQPAPNFKSAYETLTRMRGAVAAFTQSGGSVPATEAGAGADAPQAGAQGAPGAAVGGGPPGRVESREDVVRGLDAVIDYYARKEPTSPVPLVLQRAKAWVELDFLGLLNDIAPDAIDSARGGAQPTGGAGG